MLRSSTGLILTGGGARAAYQIGVLQALQQLRQHYASTAERARGPFDVISGTSAGAINAAALASEADDFDLGVTRLAQVWRGFHAAQVYRADSLGVLRTGAGWLTMMSVGWLLARWMRLKPRSLLDNTPLAHLLSQWVRLERVPQLIAQGHLQALAVSASSYSTGTHVTFYDAACAAQPWQRSQRQAQRARLTVQHLLASSAIPFVFPATPLVCQGRTEWFGDGSMRQVAPISPAIHLGATKVLVVGAGRLREPLGLRQLESAQPPPIAQIAGHALSSIFLDALAVDVERLQRINHTLSLLPPSAHHLTTLRPIEVLVIAPSQRLDDLAARHFNALPLPVRALLRGVGVSGSGPGAQGAALASYLLFEADYTRELMALGVADTLARRQEVCEFFSWNSGLLSARA
jgi:NTE family protein